MTREEVKQLRIGDRTQNGDLKKIVHRVDEEGRIYGWTATSWKKAEAERSANPKGLSSDLPNRPLYTPVKSIYGVVLISKVGVPEWDED